MRIVAVSDTHMRHDEIVMPDGDVLVHAGDATWLGQPTEFMEFCIWLARQKERYKHVIYIAGNHDWIMQLKPDAGRALLKNAGVTYLQDSGIEVDGVRFWGSPWTVKFSDWAFMKPQADLVDQWKLIPANTNVLITHGPPYGSGDWTPYGNRADGDKALAERIRQLGALRAHIFGHFHSGYGIRPGDHGTPPFVSANVAICDELYDATRKPTIIDVEPDKTIDS